MGKISINLEQSSLDFLDKVTDNRSAYINDLIQEQQRKDFETKLEADYLEQSNDLQWQAEVAVWDCTAADGLDEGVEGMVRLEKENE